MPAPIIGWAISALASNAGAIVVSAMTWIGLAWATSEYLLPELRGFVLEQVSGAPAVFVQYAGYVGADVAMSMLLSAAAVRAARDGLKLVRKRQVP